MGASIPLLIALAATGPAQLGAPKVTFDPPVPRLADLVLVYVENSDPEIKAGAVRAFGYEFKLFRVSADKLRAALAVPMVTDPGDHVLKIELGRRLVHVKMPVANRSWDTSTLKVSKEFTQKKPKELIERLKREEKELLAVFENDPDPPHFIGSFGRPVEGEVTGVFGTRRIFNGKLNSIHFGLDLDGKIGDTIRAIQGGKVVMSSMRWASGGTIILDHGGGLYTAYFHMSRRDHQPGDWVKGGEVLGAVGKSGRVTGPHLHLQFFLRARRLDHNQPTKPRTLQVDPQRALELKFEGDPKYLVWQTAKAKMPGVGGDDEFGGSDER